MAEATFLMPGLGEVVRGSFLDNKKQFPIQ